MHAAGPRRGLAPSRPVLQAACTLAAKKQLLREQQLLFRGGMHGSTKAAATGGPKPSTRHRWQHQQVWSWQGAGVPGGSPSTFPGVARTACWGTRRPRPDQIKVILSTQRFSQIALRQECDDGAAAKEALLQLGLRGLQPGIVGGASFTHGRWDRNFLHLLKGLWGSGCHYTAVTLVTSKWTTPETLTDAVEEVREFGEWYYGIPIRLIDVVGESYTAWWKYYEL